MTNSPRAKIRLLSACVVAVGLMLFTACSGGSEDGADSDDSGASSFEEGSGTAADSESAMRVSNENLPITSLADRELIKTGTISLESADIDQVLDDLDAIVATYRGIVESEDTRTDDDGDVRDATVVLRVPVDSFEAAVDEITGLGVLIREQKSAEDVTTRVADVDARVESAQRSIDQLQLLFSRATKLGDVIALESELSQRQAELESLQARQRALARQTALSTIHLSIAKPDAAPERDDGDQAGFVDGIKSGWDSLVTFVQGTAHVVGLVLPLGVLALIVAMPVWMVVRRWHPVSRG